MKLCDAINDGNIEVVEEIVRNEEVDINGCDWRGLTPLMCAVRRGHHDILRRVLKAPGIDLGRCDGYGFTALHHACDYNRVSVIKLLCQDSRCSPSVVNKKDSNSNTPLMRAV